MAEKGLFLYDNTLWRPGVTLTASSEALPVSRLLDYRPGRKWRATGDTAEWVKVDHGAVVDIDTVFVYAMNATNQPSLDATVRVRISANADMSSPLFDETFEIWPPVTGYGDLYGIGYGGYPVLSAFAAFTQRRLIRLGAMYSARYLRLDFADPSNPSGYIEVGIVMAGQGYQPTRNFTFGWDVDHDDPSEQDETDGGAVLITARPSARVLSLAMGKIPLGEALGYVDDMKRIVGRKRPLLFAPFPDGSLNRIYRTTIYGVVKTWAPIVNIAPERATVSGMTIRELAAP